MHIADRTIPKRAVWSWILYDRADVVYPIVPAISMGIIFVISPLLGAMTDRARRRMPFLVVSTLLCVGCTVLIARSGYWVTMLAFIFANAAYQAGLQFYDTTLFVVASMAGVALGGIWSADRPLMLRLTPPDRIGEFYGLYGMVGRFSAIVGPLVWAAVAWLCIVQVGMQPERGQGIAVLVLLSFTVVAWWILGPVSDEPRAVSG